MKHPSFIKNIFLRFALTLPVNFKGIIVIPLLTRIYTQDIYGAWLQIALIKEVFVVLLSLRLETALIRYLYREKNPEQLIKAVFTITLACSLCFLSSIYFFRDHASIIIFGKQELSSILLVASLWIVVNACMQIGLAVLRSQERIAALSIRELLSALWLVCAVSFAYLIDLGIQRLIWICITGDTILLVWILFQIGVPFPITSLFKSVADVRKFLPYSLPLIFNSLFLWFTSSIDRLIIVHLIGLASVGVYGVSLQVSLLLTVVLSPITFVLFPRVVASWNLKNKDDVNHFFSQAVSLTLILSAPVIVGLFIVSHGLIPLLAGQSYSTSSNLILFLLLAGLAKGIYQNHIFVIHLVEKTLFLPILFISTAATNYVLCYLFVLKFNIIGAAIARFITFGIMAFIITIWGRKYVKFSIPWCTIFKVALASTMMGISISWMPVNTWVQLFIAVIIGTLVYLLLLFIFRVLTFEKLTAIKRQVI